MQHDASPSQTGTNPYGLELKGLSKYYQGIRALDDVSIRIRAGETHALAGQNGAGKSTIIKLLSGIIQPTHGQIFIEGEKKQFQDPMQAQGAGIQTIHQELSLVPQLSVAENICLGAPPRFGRVLQDKNQVRREASAALERLGFSIDVNIEVASLTVAEQQIVELAKALRRSARVVLFDEPTSALTTQDSKNLFEVIRQIAQQGTTVIFISHYIDEIFELCDSVTVLRNGLSAMQSRIDETSLPEVINAMVGVARPKSEENPESSDQSPRAARLTNAGDDLVRMDAIGDGGKVKDVSISLWRGRIVGVYGLLGSGQSELAEVISGYRPLKTGRIRINDKVVRLRSPRDAIRAGIALLPQDRKARGFVGQMSVTHNMSLSSLRAFSRFSVIKRGRETATSQEMSDRLQMRIASLSQELTTLSGGNQQKVIIAKWLINGANILICDEPTRGIDVGAKKEIYGLLRSFVDNGGSILIASSELDEAMMCDEVFIMQSGYLTSHIQASDFGAQGDGILSLLQ